MKSSTKKLLSIILSLLIISSLFCGCDFFDFFLSKPSENSSATSESESEKSSHYDDSKNWPVTVEGVTLDSKPTKVASLSPALTEITFDLGYGSYLVCVSDYCDYPSEVSSLPKSGSPLIPDCDQIIKSGAEILLTSSDLHSSYLTILNDAGIKTIVIPPAKSLPSLERLYKSVATVFDGKIDGSTAAKNFYNKCEETLSNCKDVVSSFGFSSKDPACVLYLRSLSPAIVATVDTLESNLLENIGFINAASGYGDWNYPSALISSLAPDYIFYSSLIIPDDFVASDLYSAFSGNLKRFVLTDMSLFERQGKRMFDELYRAVSLMA